MVSIVMQSENEMQPFFFASAYEEFRFWQVSSKAGEAVRWSCGWSKAYIVSSTSRVRLALKAGPKLHQRIPEIHCMGGSLVVMGLPYMRIRWHAERQSLPHRRW